VTRGARRQRRPARGEWALVAAAVIGALGLATATAVGVSALTDRSRSTGSQRDSAIHPAISPSHGVTTQRGTGSKRKGRPERRSRPSALPHSPPPAYESPTPAANPGHRHLRQTPEPSPSPSTYAVTPPPLTYPEAVGGPTNTWSDPTDAGGTEGEPIAPNTTVQVTCRVDGFTVQDGNPWWYRIATDPWNNSYYASADAFYNNGSSSGSLSGTPFYDPAVPVC
jgi:hypothetical protein